MHAFSTCISISCFAKAAFSPACAATTLDLLDLPEYEKDDDNKDAAHSDLTSRLQDQCLLTWNLTFSMRADDLSPIHFGS